MSIAQALRTSRKDRGLQQDELDVPYSKSMVSMIERGERQIATDMAPHLAAKLDHPAMYAELIRELTGVGPAWLDGPNVDLHRSSVREESLEELQQTIDAINECASSRPPSSETKAERDKRYAHLMQVLDSTQALWIYVGIQCQDYGFSMGQLYADHHKKLRSMRYLKG